MLLAGLCPVWAGFVISDAKLNQGYPAVGFDAASFLVTWQDVRDLETDSSANIYGGRVAPAGQLLDSAGFLVASGPREQLVPRLAWNGEEHLLIWQEGC